MRCPSQTLLLLCAGMPPAAFAFMLPSRHPAGRWGQVTIRTTTATTRPCSLNHRRNKSSFTRLMADSDDDDDDYDEDGDDGAMAEPLAKGVNSVAWLPSVVGATTAPTAGSSLSSSDDSKTEVLPLFPLGGIVYTPNSEHVLNIFEPRYRQMYSDILMNGTKRFVVSMSHPTKSGSFAQTGVLFQLEDLKEVSEQTGDKIKFICNHKVTGRVKLHRILNPEAWEKRDTYLRVEGTIMDDSGGKKDETDSKTNSNDVYGTLVEALPANSKEERELRDAFSKLVDIQHDLEEDVRFTRASVPTLAVKPGAGEDGLWKTIRLWQSFADQRLMARQNELQQDFQNKLLAFLKKDRGFKDNEIPGVIRFEDLSPVLKKEVEELQKRMAVELKPLMLESTLSMQKILEADDHNARLKLVRYFVEAETKRLETKKALKGMFTSTSSGVPPEERVVDAKKKSAELDKSGEKSSKPASAQSSLFTDEPDAFQ